MRNSNGFQDFKEIFLHFWATNFQFSRNFVKWNHRNFIPGFCVWKSLIHIPFVFFIFIEFTLFFNRIKKWKNWDGSHKHFKIWISCKFWFSCLNFVYFKPLNHSKIILWGAVITIFAKSGLVYQGFTWSWLHLTMHSYELVYFEIFL